MIHFSESVMKKALQNPYLVGILAILALVYVVRTVVKKPGSAYSAAAAAQESTAAEAKQKARGKSRTSRIDSALAEWSGIPERNPFRSRPEETEDAEAAGGRATLPPVLPNLQLSAIWLDKGRKLAVINGRVVEVGERISDYEVTEILPHQIVLSGNGRRTVIRFPERSESAARRVAYHHTEP